jgi:hypothetical protein
MHIQSSTSRYQHVHPTRLLVRFWQDNRTSLLQDSLLRALLEEATTLDALEVRQSNSFADSQSQGMPDL